MRGRAWFISLATLCLCPRISSAGLIFELDNIDGHRIDVAVVKTDRLEIESHGHSQAFRFPAGVGALLVDWERIDTGGPLMFSIDGSLVSTDGDDYWPPSVPRELAMLIFGYDGYAHEIACGATPQTAEEHPLVRRAGDRMLPYRLHRTLLDSGTQSPQAYAYRKLAERFVKPPGCVGELTLYAKPGGGDMRVAIEPKSWVSMMTEQWYRTVDVPSEGDEWVASLPYQPLRQDIERHWPEYRAAFPSLAALSSIVEAMAVLRAIKRDAPLVWQALERGVPAHQPLAGGQIGRLHDHALDPQPWKQLAYAWIGQRVETPAEANLAIGLAVGPGYDLDGDPRMLAIDGLDEVAARDPTTAAKLELARMVLDGDLASNPAAFVKRSERLFDMLLRSPQAFRLRAVALTMISRIALDGMLWNRDVLQLLTDQKRALENDFLRRAESACASSSGDLVTWESLTQDVYSVGLLAQLRRDDLLSPRIVAAVACIHFHRGMAPQQGRELAYRHVHYRFLQYLSQSTDDVRTQRQIVEHRRVLAKSMNLHDWDQEIQELP